MRWANLLLFIGMAVGWPSANSNAEAFVWKENTQGPIALNAHLSAYATPDELSAEQVWARIQSGLWPKQGDTLNAGFTESFYWLMFQLKNETADPLILEVKNPQINLAELYRITDGVPVHVGRAGDELPLSQHTNPNRRPVFQLDFLEAPDGQTYLLLLDKRHSSLQFPMDLWSPTEFARSEFWGLVAHGVILSLMGLACLLSILLAINLKRTIFWYYAGYSLFSGIYVLATIGYLYVLFHPETPEWTTYTRPVSLVLGWICLLPFSRHYFQAGKNWPVVNRFIVFIQGVFVILFVGWGLFPQLYIEHIPVVLSVLYTLLLVSAMAIGALALRDFGKNRLRAGFFISAFLTMLIITPLGIVVEYGWLDPRIFGVHALIPLVSLEVIFLASGLFVQFKKIWRERGDLRDASVEARIQVKRLEQELQQKKVEQKISRGVWELRNHELSWEAIRYISVDGHYLEVYCADKNRPLIERYRMSDAQSELPEEHFMRIHRGVIVGKKYVSSVGSNEVELEDGTRLQVSKSYWGKVKSFKPLIAV